MRFEWAIVQTGQLPLRPSGVVMRQFEHRSTSVLLWPDHQAPSHENTILTDPCFTLRGIREAGGFLKHVGLSLWDVACIFVSHPHADHEWHLPLSGWYPAPRGLGLDAAPPGTDLVACPGHHPHLRALVFHSVADGEVWVVGDAILDLETLRAWAYYWPNHYTAEEIRLTWRTTATILSRADLVIPGHGAPIRVTASLLDGLIRNFPRAELAGGCPEVIPAMLGRINRLPGAPS